MYIYEVTLFSLKWFSEPSFGYAKHCSSTATQVIAGLEQQRTGIRVTFSHASKQLRQYIHIA